MVISFQVSDNRLSMKLNNNKYKEHHKIGNFDLIFDEKGKFSEIAINNYTKEHEKFIRNKTMLVEILNHKENWDSYGAKPVKPETARYALELADKIFSDNTPKPNISPVPNGGIQFDWNTKGIDLEIEITPDNKILVLFEDSLNGIDEEIELTNDLDKLIEIITRLSR